MKFNKLFFGSILLVPLFLGSCNPDSTKIKGLTIDAYETLYAYSDNNIVNIKIEYSDVEFVENQDFKSEYLKFDSPNQLSGKTISKIERTSSKNIKLTFTGCYTGDAFEQRDNVVELKYKISKEAFKKNKVEVIEDSTGKMIMKRDYVKLTGIEGGDTNSLGFTIKLASSPTVVYYSGIRISNGFTTMNNIPASEFCNGFTSGTVNVTYEPSNYELTFNLQNLNEATQGFKHAFYIHNTSTLNNCFENGFDAKGFKIDIETELDQDDYVYKTKQYVIYDDQLYMEEC